MQDWVNLWKTRKGKKKRGKRSRRKKGFLKKMNKATLIKKLSLLTLFGALASVFLVLILFGWYAKDLPSPDSVVRRSGFSTKILARDGELLHDLYEDVNRVPVKLADVPLHMQQATIAVEDKDFYKHGGFDPKGILRAAFKTIVLRNLQGGSTLTQQLVKNVLLTNERTLARKFKELVLSIQIERKFNKDEILQMYLNEAPYGGTAWGIAAASQRYFKIDPGELSLVQSAILAGLPQAPTRYSPYGTSPKAYIGRAKTVLRRMREDDYITKEEQEKAEEELGEVEFAQQDNEIRAPHFVFYVREKLEEILGEGVIEQGGLTVKTSLNWDLQEKAQKIVSEEIEKIESLHVTNGAVMVMDPVSGEILVMVGSKDFFAEDYDGQVNVVMSERQPGSAIKPVTYAAAFESGYSPATMLLDVPTKFGVGSGEDPYEPKNYDGEFRGPVQLRFALGSSLNVPSVKLLALTGVEDMLSLAYDMGFETLEPTKANMKRFGLSVTLGGGEVKLFDLVRAYSAFANGGEALEPISILEIKRGDEVVYEAKQTEKKRVLSEEVAFLINHILYDNNARLLTFGENSYLNMYGRPIAVKTGTTNDMRDNWTVGWSSNAVVGVWVGNNDNSPMKQVASGVTGASPIWRRIMLEAYEDYGGDDFSPPEGVEVGRVDSISGYPEHDGFAARSEYFVKGTLPSGPDPVHKKLKICRGQDKLATKVDIERGEYEEKEYVVLKDYDPYGGFWEDEVESWLEGVEDGKYHPPEEYCDSQEDIIVRFENPKDKERIDNNQIKVKIKVLSEVDLKSLKLSVKKGDEVVVEEEFTKKEVETELSSLSKGSYDLVAVAENEAGKGARTVIRIGVKQAWDEEPSPTPIPEPSKSSEASKSGSGTD